MNCCCWKFLFGSPKQEDLTKDLISNEEKPDQIERIIEEDDGVESEVSTEIDYENEIFENADSDHEEDMSQNSSNASTVVRFIDSLTLRF